MVSLADFATVDALLAILGIVIGLAIFLMQKRAGDRINGIIKTQFRRQELEKKYFGTRIMSNLELVKKNYAKLEQYLGDYLKDPSLASRNKVKNFSSFQSNNLDEYIVPSLRSDLGRLIEFIDDLKLVDELTAAFDDLSSVFKDCSVDSTFEDSESLVKEAMESARRQFELVRSLLSRFAEEIPTAVD